MYHRKSHLLKALLIYPLVFVTFTIIYLLLFHLPIQKIQPVLFYRGILFLICTLIICILFGSFYLIRTKKFAESMLAALVISFSFHLVFFVVFPVTFDRSLTMFLYKKISNNQRTNSFCSGPTKNELNQFLSEDYIIKQKALDKRLSEQAVIQNFSIKNQCVSLTRQGRSFLKFSEIIKIIYNVK